MALILSPVAVPQCCCPRCHSKNISLRYLTTPALLAADLVFDRLSNERINIENNDYQNHFDTWLCMDCDYFDFPSNFVE